MKFKNVGSQTVDRNSLILDADPVLPTLLLDIRTRRIAQNGNAENDGANLGMWQDAQVQPVIKRSYVMSEIYNGAKYFFEENSNFFKKVLTML